MKILRRTYLGLLASALATGSLSAHDEGHGPKLREAAKFGGKLAPVVIAGKEGQIMFKAELLRNSKGALKIYVFTPDMKPADLSKFSSAQLTAEQRKGKEKSTVTLKAEQGFFAGELPNMKGPFSVDVEFKTADATLIAGFGMMD